MEWTSPPGPEDLHPPHITMTMLALWRPSNPRSTFLRRKVPCDRRKSDAAHADTLRSSPLRVSCGVYHLSGPGLHLRGRARHATRPGAIADSVCVGVYGLLRCVRRLRDAHGVARRPMGPAANADPHCRRLVAVHDLYRNG